MSEPKPEPLCLNVEFSDDPIWCKPPLHSVLCPLAAKPEPLIEHPFEPHWASPKLCGAVIRRINADWSRTCGQPASAHAPEAKKEKAE